MTIYLNLGVNDIPYRSRQDYEAIGPIKPTRRKRRHNPNKPTRDELRAFLGLPQAAPITTGAVATILESRYGILSTFAERYMPQIGNALAHSVAGALESLIMGGGSLDSGPFKTAEDEITQSMKLFLDLREMDGKPGVPTMAARRS